MVLSILICSIYERAGMLSSLLNELHRQIHECDANDKVEILVELDNKGQSSTGTKRNKLYQRANGIYSVSQDDDDSIPEYFIKELLIAAESDADCFAINGYITTNGKEQCPWYISIHNRYETVVKNGQMIHYRYPNHITPIKSSIAKQVLFDDITIREDYNWATEIHNRKLLKNEHIISKPMYFYKYVTNK